MKLGYDKFGQVLGRRLVPMSEFLISVTTGYSSLCIQTGVGGFIQFSSGKVDRILNNIGKNQQSLVQSVQRILLGRKFTQEDISLLNILLGNEEVRNLLIVWSDSKPKELGGIRLNAGLSSFDKVIGDLRDKVIGDKKTFIEWLSCIPNKESMPKNATGFKSGGIYFTIFGIYLPDGTLLSDHFYRIFSSKELSQYSGKNILIGNTQIYEIERDKFPIKSFRYYNTDSTPFELYDKEGNRYDLLQVNDGRVFAKKIGEVLRTQAMPSGGIGRKVPRKNEGYKWYEVDSNGCIIPLDNTLGAPSA